MNESFSADAASGLAADHDIAGLDRQAAATAAQSSPLPSGESEEWRYSPIGDLPLGALSPALAASTSEQSSAVADPLAAAITQRSATVVLDDGFVVSIEVDPGWQAKGLSVSIDASAASPVQAASSLVDDRAESFFGHLHRAFSPQPVVIAAPKGLTVSDPVVVVNHHSSTDVVSFPHLVIAADEASDIAVVEYQSSVDGFSVSVPHVSLHTAQAARLNYVAIQEHSPEHWQIGQQVSYIDAQATLTSGLAAFGGRYARSRTDSRLVGRGSTANLIAAYYGDGDQTLDFRTFQHHEARDTRSDLLFKGSLDDKSGSIYTGLINIHPEGAGTNAFQTNRNVKLSDEAWAWSVPNLEINNNDVHCSHASTVSPIDEEQRFYLHARGVPPVVADRLVVAGFYQEVLDRIPVAGAAAEIRRLISTKLDRRAASV